MRLLRSLRRRLAVKLFLTYLIVVVVGVVVLATAAELAIPSSFQRHMAAMGPQMGGMMGGMNMGMDLDMDLFASFRNAVHEALWLAALAAFGVALVVSVFISQRIVAPVKEMMAVSQRISSGHYSDRVGVPGVSSESMDELGQLALSFNAMAEKLETTEAMRMQLIADVAHELRTPLTTIKGTMEGLIDGVLPGENETYQQVSQEADRMQRLVHDLQELSRVEAGAYELRLASVNLGDLVRAACNRLERQYTDKRVELLFPSPGDSVRARVDEDRLTQVLLNLLGNALQYTPAGGKVRIELERSEDQVAVGVADSGAGIAPEHLSLIFTRFYRIDKSRARVSGGSGIGLTIAKHIVEAHGGRIWAESPGLGQGATFVFTLPLEPVGPVG